MMSSKIFWAYINSHANEVSAMMNDWMIGLLNTNDGRVEFIKEDSNGYLICNSNDIASVELNEMYAGGVCVSYADESTQSFNSLTIEEMRRVLQLVEKNVGVEE